MQNILFSTLGFIQNMGPVQVLVVVFLILLLFGAKRLPELGRGMGTFIREFKKTTQEIEDDIRSSIEDQPAPAPKKIAHPKESTAPANTES